MTFNNWPMALKLLLGLTGLLMALFAVDLMLFPAFASEVVNPDAEYLKQAYEVIKSLGGLDFVGRISAVTLIIIGSMKVSFLRPLWTRLGKYQAWSSLGLGFILGLSQALSGQEFSWSIVIAYTFSGGGAIILHEVLKSVREMPWVGEAYKGLIAVLMDILGGAKVKAKEELLKAQDQKLG